MLSLRLKGFEDLADRLERAPRDLEKQMNRALNRSIAMAETESKRRTPVDTGYLKSSIGGGGGFRFVRGLRAGVGTNVKYAVYVHENQSARHPVGQAKFMELGLKAAIPFIKREMKKVASKLVLKLAR